MLYKKIILFFTIFILEACSGILAQPQNFRHYHVQDGVSQSEIICIYQDREGFLWFGTQNGLNKFDGYAFENYFAIPGDTTSLSSNWIYSITEDPAGDLLIATRSGLNKYDKKSGKFSLVEYKSAGDEVTDRFVYGITSDSLYLYVNIPPLLSIIDTRSNLYETFKCDFDYEGILYDDGSPIIKDKRGFIWIGSHNGIHCLDTHIRQFVDFSTDNDASVSNEHITALHEDKEGRIWIGTENGLNCYDPGTGNMSVFYHNPADPATLSHNFIRAIVQDRKGYLWIGTGGGGLDKCIYDSSGSLNKLANYRNGPDKDLMISHDIIYSLYEDHSENLWIGTLSGIDKTDLKIKQIRRYNKSENASSYDLLDDVIASVFEEDEELLWIGTWGKGLNILNRKTREVIHYTSGHVLRKIPENHVHVIFRDSNSRIWIGTRNGLSIYRKETEQFIPVQDFFNNESYDRFRNVRIYCIMEDIHGKLWVGTGNGIIILDLSGEKVESIQADSTGSFKISNNLVYSLHQDREGDIWIATAGGLDRLMKNGNRVIHYQNDPAVKNSICDNFTIALNEDDDGDIWISTIQGLNRFNKEDSVFTWYSVRDGLPSNIIYNILKDNKGNLWFSSGSGIAWTDPSEDLPEFRIVDELRGLEFNLKAVCTSENGELFFGGMDGLVSFHPDSLKTNTYIPPVRITSFEKERDDVRQKVNIHSEEIVLSYKDYSFTIKFSAVDYSNPGKNRYEYMMKGISDKWNNIENRNFVHFTNLPPGEYVFHVKGSNDDGLWNEEPAVLQIRINPPWWRSDYAYATYLLILILLVVTIIKLRERNLISEKNRLEEKVQIRTAEIERQKEELKDLNATKDRFFSILAHDLKNPFTNLYSLSSLLKKNYQGLDEEDRVMAVKNINKSAEFIYNLLENLLTWSRSQRGLIKYNPALFNLNNVVDVNINLYRPAADKKGIKIISKLQDEQYVYADREMTDTVIRNLLSNAVKFTGTGGEIIISAINHNNEIILNIEDQGTGIPGENISGLFNVDKKYNAKGTDGETGTGLGLVLCREFVEKSGGRIWCESELGKGSVFSFTIRKSNRVIK